MARLKIAEVNIMQGYEFGLIIFVKKQKKQIPLKNGIKGDCVGTIIYCKSI